jgi:hypothetical protein
MLGGKQYDSKGTISKSSSRHSTDEGIDSVKPKPNGLLEFGGSEFWPGG